MREAPPKKTDEILLNKQEGTWYDARNFYLNGVSFAIQQSQQLSVAISKMQGLTTVLKVFYSTNLPCSQFEAFNQKIPKGMNLQESIQYERALGVQIIMLAPLAPHFASELWSAFVDNAHRRSSDFDWVSL